MQIALTAAKPGAIRDNSQSNAARLNSDLAKQIADRSQNFVLPVLDIVCKNDDDVGTTFCLIASQQRHRRKQQRCKSKLLNDRTNNDTMKTIQHWSFALRWVRLPRTKSGWKTKQLTFQELRTVVTAIKFQIFQREPPFERNTQTKRMKSLPWRVRDPRFSSYDLPFTKHGISNYSQQYFTNACNASLKFRDGQHSLIDDMLLSESSIKNRWFGNELDRLLGM